MAAMSQAEVPAVIDVAPSDPSLNSCVGARRQELLQDVALIAEHRRPKEARALVEALLCGTDRASARRALSHMPKKLTLRSGGTGQEDSLTLVDRTADLRLRGKAWSADVEKEDRGMSVNAWANEACIKAFRLRYWHDRWLVVQVSEGCD
jgi:hypothetical protein